MPDKKDTSQPVGQSRAAATAQDLPTREAIDLLTRLLEEVDRLQALSDARSLQSTASRRKMAQLRHQ
jgi:hypothetical protein